MYQLLLSVSFVLSTGALLLILGLFLDYLHQIKVGDSSQKQSS